MPQVGGFSRKEMQEFQARDDMETLQRAKAIEASPERMSAIKEMAESVKKQADEVTGGKDSSAEQMLSKGFRSLKDASGA